MASSAPTNGTKRPIIQTDHPPVKLSEKKLRRLEKNRISARECRRRKREAAEELQKEINLLETQNLQLRLQLKGCGEGSDQEPSNNEDSIDVHATLEALLKSGASESEMYENIEELKHKYADYGRDRRSAVEFHLRNVERLLMPTTTTSVAMRAFEGFSNNATSSSLSDSKEEAENDSADKSINGKLPCTKSDVAEDTDNKSTREIPFKQQNEANKAMKEGTDDGTLKADKISQKVLMERTDPKSLFHYLVNYLEVTPEQANALKDSRKVAQELDTALAKSLFTLEKLKQQLLQCAIDLETELDGVRTILSPTQVAKFVLWINNNQACMHMLNILWKQGCNPPFQEA